MKQRYVVTIREGAKITRERYADLDAALRPIAARTDRPVARALFREVEPADQIVARAEITGRGRLRAGVDVRGDGSAQAFRGRVRRSAIESQPGEDAFQALRRTLS